MARIAPKALTPRAARVLQWLRPARNLELTDLKALGPIGAAGGLTKTWWGDRFCKYTYVII